MEAKLLSKQDVADLARISKRSVERLTRRGVLHGFRPAGMKCIRYQREKIVAWINGGCKVPPRGSKSS